MGCVIDSCILIDWERGKIDLAKIIEAHQDDSFYISVITASELLHGVHRATDLGTQHRRSAFVEEVLKQFPLLEMDLNAARIHAEIWADMVKSGVSIGGHDLWIAASCIADGHELITSNTKDFKRIAGLKLLPI